MAFPLSMRLIVPVTRCSLLEEVVENLVTLGIANLLENHLLGRLRTNPPEIDRLKRLFEIVPDFDIGILLLKRPTREYAAPQG